MNCREVKKFLGDYIDGSLDKNLKTSLQEHLKTCKGCASELVELKKYFNDVRSLRKIPAPENFLEKIHERLESGKRFKKMLRALFTPVQIKIPLEAAGAVAVTAAVVFLLWVFPLQTEEQIAMAPLKSESALVEQKSKGKPLEPDLPGEDLDLEAEEKDEIDIPKTRVKSAPPAQEEAGGIAAVETGEPELKNETGKAAFEPETGLHGTDPGEYLEESIESVMKESADRSVSEETSGAGLALRKQMEDDGPVEVALLFKSSAAGEPDVPVTARKKADAGFKEKSLQDDEFTAGVRGMILEKRAEEPMPLQTLDDVLSVLKDLTREMGGDIMSVEYDTETSRPRLITVKIPAENYTLFLAELYLVGEPWKKPSLMAAQEKEFVSLEIELIISF